MNNRLTTVAGIAAVLLTTSGCQVVGQNYGSMIQGTETHRQRHYERAELGDLISDTTPDVPAPPPKHKPCPHHKDNAGVPTPKPKPKH